MNKIYLDYAATTPVDPAVVKAMEPYWGDVFANASSPHAYGRQAAKALEDARDVVAKFIGATPAEVVFTSGATESNNHAIFGTARSLAAKGNHIIVSKIEHHSVLEPAEYLQREGFKVTWLETDADGLISPQALAQAITDKTILISIMSANNEIGTIQPIRELGQLARDKGIVFHVDAVQSLGQVPLDLKAWPVDLLSLSAHKIYGPKGVGALFVRRGTKLPSYLIGGGQEKGQRASTQNVAGAGGLAKAVELCQRNMDQEIEHQIELRDYLIRAVLQRIENSRLNGHPSRRLPKNANFSFENIQGESLLTALDMAGIAVSMGSACSSGAMEPSHVLRAIGLSDELAFGSLRITLGRWTTRKEIDYLSEQLPVLVKRLRG